MSKSKTKSNGNKGVKLKDYFESIDLYSWWEQFSLSFAENGQHKYITVHSFIKAKTSDPKKREFLWWVLGPKEGEPRNKEFKTYPQFDWQNKRGNEFWLSNQKVEDIKHAASSRMNAIDEVRATGEFNLDSLGRLQILLHQLDSEYAGRLNLPNLSAKENSIRLNEYFSLRSKLQGQLHDAQMMFARTRSVDMAQLESLLQVVGPSLIGQITGNTNQVDPATQRKLDAFTDMSTMMLEKANAWNIKLPDADAEKIIRKASSPITIDRKTKVN
jgi:hypothetical protein